MKCKYESKLGDGCLRKYNYHGSCPQGRRLCLVKPPSKQIVLSEGEYIVDEYKDEWYTKFGRVGSLMSGSEDHPMTLLRPGKYYKIVAIPLKKKK